MKVGINRIYNYFQPEQKLQKQLANNITVQGCKKLSQPNCDKNVSFVLKKYIEVSSDVSPVKAFSFDVFPPSKVALAQALVRFLSLL